MMIFLHIPKTGGTTFQFILENSFGIYHCHLGHLGKKINDQRDMEFVRRIFPWMRSIAGESLVAPMGLSLPNPFYTTFVREPVARVFSHYQDNVLRGKSRLTFEEMLRSDEMLENIHVKLMAGSRNLDQAKFFLEKCDFVGLTERFDLSLHVLGRLSPYRLNLNYKRKLAARDNTIKKSLENDSRMVELAREYNKLDLELYAFAVNEIFPKVCAKAGFTPADKVVSCDTYTSEIKPNFLLHRLYNQTFFRNICKIYKKRRARELALSQSNPTA
jgi:Sulfotransferase family